MISRDFTDCLRNVRPPWSAYQSIISDRLIALDKQPGIRPVGVVDTWRRLMAKCLLQVTGKEAKTACGTDQFSGGVEAGIEVGIHAMHFLWKKHSQEED